LPHRRWFVQRTNQEYIKYLSRAASVSSAFAQILINRGIKTPEAVKGFVSPSVDDLIDPVTLSGVKEATSIIKDAIKSGKGILVHGDYDADGITGTAIMFSAIERLGGKVSYFIPERLKHGYGFHKTGVEYAKGVGAELIITVDCGITSFEAVKIAKEEGIEVIITDHHEPKHDKTGALKIPDASAVVNPRLDSDVPVLSGSAVALKVAQALLGTEEAVTMLDLACLGTVADVIPLIEESRVIVKEGLELINEAARPGIRALKEVSGINGRTLSAGLLSFTLIPRINASGRIDHAGSVLELLITDNPDEAYKIAHRIDKLNSKRQKIEEDVHNEAMEQLNYKGYDLTIVLASEGWHEGVVGIVASRLTEMYYRPSFVFTIKDGIAQGSARSIPSFDLYEGLLKCSDILLSFGGHRQAAGLRLDAERLKEFEERMNQIIAETLTDEDLIPTLTLDASVSLKEVNFNLLREIKLLEPLGYGNPEPVLGTKGLEVIEPRVVGNNHLKMRLKDRSVYIDAIGFDLGEMLEVVESSSRVDVAYIPQINEWEGGKNIQLRLVGVRPSDI
jgi:single-stranded-DNA-specific exonuclease